MSVPVKQLPGLVVDQGLVEGVADALDGATGHLALHERRVQRPPDILHGDP